MKLTNKMDTCNSLVKLNLLDLFSPREKEQEIHGEFNALSASVGLIYIFYSFSQRFISP